MNFEQLYYNIKHSRLHPWLSPVRSHIEATFRDNPHGKLEEWKQALSQLPLPIPSSIDFAADRIRAGLTDDINNDERSILLDILKQFHPWRKGPYEIFGIHIDTEWRSDLKWQRIIGGIEPLSNRLVLDVGCGNGYHMWRMLGENAKMVIGADPSQFFLMQFSLLKHYLGPELPIHLIPARSEDLPALDQQGFDSVFSMGVLYHRKSPFNHLQELRGFLRPGGQLILETLVVEGDEQTLLFPQDRYAKMRNVWFIPSVAMLKIWLERLGFTDISLLDVTRTTQEEQRATEWMTFESLQDFLDPENPEKTIEGYPAPMRASICCTRG